MPQCLPQNIPFSAPVSLPHYLLQNIPFSPDKAKSLHETKEYASQSLASVAYQIHSLAVNILQMMDQQTIQLQKMQSNANNIGLVSCVFYSNDVAILFNILPSFSPFASCCCSPCPEQNTDKLPWERGAHPNW